MKDQRVPVVEWQTIVVLFGNYAVFLAVCYFYHALPWWLVLLVGGYTVGLHGSLQHEVIHGHPTRSKALNEWLVFPALGLWLPYELYRDTHLQHHVDELITDPFDDPESYYVGNTVWARLSTLHKRCYQIRNTVMGRLLLGPLWACAAMFISEISRFQRSDYSHLKLWGWHLMSVSVVVCWILYCNIPLLEYVLLFAYPGLAVTMLRSFLEHQTNPDPSCRTAIVQSGKVMGLLFLNNNLHALHHEQPALPWYRLPQVWKENSSGILRRNGGYFYSGYWAVIKQYLYSPKAHPRHPYR